MLQKIMSALKSPVFWSGFAAGVIVGTAFPKLRDWAKPVASKIPGATAS